MREDHRRFQQHEDEEIVAAVRQLFKIDRELNRTYATVNGRPMFTVPLSDEEQWLRWENPTQRQQIMKQIEEREGPEAVTAYVHHMATVAKRRGTARGAPASPAPPPRPTVREY
jgi:hypothetical protein